MKAITIYQPFSSLIAIGVNPYETRGHAPPRKLIGERIAIHAAKGIWRLDADLLNRAEYQLRIHRQPSITSLPRGAVICTAVLTGAYRCGERIIGRGGPMFEVSHRMNGSPASNTYIPIDAYGDYSPGRWAWKLESVQIVDPPAEARGKQGFWNWDEGRP